MIACIVLMLFCAIIRLCGVLWFTADLSAVNVPDVFWQETIKGIFLVFELTFVYKILCRTKWSICLLIAIAQTLLFAFMPFLTITVKNIINLVLYFAIPFAFNRKFWTLLDSADNDLKKKFEVVDE